MDPFSGACFGLAYHERRLKNKLIRMVRKRQEKIAKRAHIVALKRRRGDAARERERLERVLRMACSERDQRTCDWTHVVCIGVGSLGL